MPHFLFFGSQIGQRMPVRHDFAGQPSDHLDAAFRQNFEVVASRLPPGPVPSDDQRQLIGAYFTAEESTEGAALTNPSMVEHPDLIGGFNRLDSTILKACHGRVLAKEGADGLLGLAIEHPEFPDGLGVVVKIAHGWNPQATWYVARYILGVLGFEFRNPYKLRRQKPFIVPEAIPPNLRERMAAIVPWDSWDPDIDKWEFDPETFLEPSASQRA